MSLEHKTWADIQDNKNKLFRYADECWRIDNEEAQKVQEVLDNDWECGDRGWRSKVEAIKNNIENTKTDIETHLTEYVQPHDGVISDMLNRIEQWGSIHSSAESIQSDLKSETIISSWEGDGAQAYQERVKKQDSAMEELKKLATTNTTVCKNVEFSNRLRFNSIHKVMDPSYYSDSSVYGVAPPSVAPVRSITKSNYSELLYFERTLTALKLLEYVYSMLKYQTGFEYETYAEKTIKSNIDKATSGLSVLDLDRAEWTSTDGTSPKAPGTDGTPPPEEPDHSPNPDMPSYPSRPSNPEVRGVSPKGDPVPQPSPSPGASPYPAGGTGYPASVTGPSPRSTAPAGGGYPASVPGPPPQSTTSPTYPAGGTGYPASVPGPPPQSTSPSGGGYPASGSGS